jgi:hypothetical protein
MYYIDHDLGSSCILRFLNLWEMDGNLEINRMSCLHNYWGLGDYFNLMVFSRIHLNWWDILWAAVIYN